jgi:phosphate transport system permease protein
MKNIKKTLQEYKRKPFSFLGMILINLGAILTVAIMLFIVAYILIKGIPNLTPELFVWDYNAKNVSMLPSIVNTLIMTFLTLLIAVPIGIFSAVYLVEYAKRGSRLVYVIRITTETLAGIPSIVYGLFGFLAFVIAMGWSYSLIAGALTLAIMVLPTIIRTTEEALLAVPDTYREGSFGLGAGKLRTVFRIIIPAAMPGILAGVILSIGRIVGETAALIFTAGTVADVPNSLFASARTLSVHMYCLLSEGLYTDQAYATAVVLLITVVGINALSNYVAKRLTKI